MSNCLDYDNKQQLINSRSKISKSYSVIFETSNILKRSTWSKSPFNVSVWKKNADLILNIGSKLWSSNVFFSILERLWNSVIHNENRVSFLIPIVYAQQMALYPKECPLKAAVMNVLIKFHENRFSSLEFLINMASSMEILVALSISVNGSPISSETLYFVDWESADGMSGNFLDLNKSYILKHQNDTNFALVLWGILVSEDI